MATLSNGTDPKTGNPNNASASSTVLMEVLTWFNMQTRPTPPTLPKQAPSRTINSRLGRNGLIGTEAGSATVIAFFSNPFTKSVSFNLFNTDSYSTRSEVICLVKTLYSTPSL